MDAGGQRKDNRRELEALMVALSHAPLSHAAEATAVTMSTVFDALIIGDCNNLGFKSICFKFKLCYGGQYRVGHQCLSVDLLAQP